MPAQAARSVSWLRLRFVVGIFVVLGCAFFAGRGSSVPVSVVCLVGLVHLTIVG